MLKKILIGIGVLVVLAAAGLGYLNHRNRTLSPPGVVKYSDADVKGIEIAYSRPSVKGRLIFGSEANDALQPFGAYWRLGANEGTELTTASAIVIGDNNLLNAGTYKVYCYPGPTDFEFAFAPADGAWGYSEPDRKEELFTLQVPVVKLTSPVEQFTIRIKKTSDVGHIFFEFSDYQLSLPFRAKAE